MHHRYQYVFWGIVFLILVSGIFTARHSWGENSAPATTPLTVVEQSIAQPVPENPVSMLFVGDVMLDRGVAFHAKKYGRESLFRGVEGLLASPDLVVVNLEGTLTTNQSIAQKNHTILRFTFDPSYAELLKKLHIDVVSLANNHALDFGKNGFDQTKQYLGAQGIFSFGSPRNDRELSTTIEVRSKKFCFIGYHDLYTYDPKPVVQEIESIKNSCDHTIVFAHWGDEYKTTENARQRLLAHMFVDAGADLIVGAHPHVVEPLEIYNSKAIFYSLGNFMFDQDFSYNTTHALAVRVEWGSNMTHFKLIPVTVKNSEVGIADEKDRMTILKMLIGARNEDARYQDIPTTQQFTIAH